MISLTSSTQILCSLERYKILSIENYGERLGLRHQGDYFILLFSRVVLQVFQQQVKVS